MPPLSSVVRKKQYTVEKDNEGVEWVVIIQIDENGNYKKVWDLVENYVKCKTRTGKVWYMSKNPPVITNADD